MRALIWFGNDLRVRDNAALRAALQEADEVLGLFCLDRRWSRPTHFGTRPMGVYREKFLHESLVCLRRELSALDVPLSVVEGDPAEQVIAACDVLGITHVFTSRPNGYYERQNVRRVCESRPHLGWQEFATGTLFTPGQVDSLLESFPETFSRFRRAVESLPVIAPEPIPGAAARGLPYRSVSLSGVHHQPGLGSEFHGGEAHGQQHLAQYFSRAGASSYKETRNALDDSAASTRFSPWLALGCISPRQVLAALRSYESGQGANESTYWIFFELLWREYFHWYEEVHGGQVYTFAGINGVRPPTTFYAQRFRAWRDGCTPWPLVNACMRRLNSTGYLSNRGRQIAASCLVNELQCDWRCGAAWFEQQLIDYDVASNWGNWQYIAGVGADPRGGRHFNLDRQAQQYDPDGRFVMRWAGSPARTSPLDAVDAADWPVEAAPACSES